MAYLDEQDPDFLRWLTTGQIGPPPPLPAATQPVTVQPPQVQPLEPMPMPQKVTMGNAMGSYSAANQRLANANADVAGVQNFQNQYVQEKVGPAAEASRMEQQGNIDRRQEESDRINKTAADIRERVKLAANDGIDPARLVKKAETWQKVSMGVSMFISGFLGRKGGGGGVNPVWQAITKLMDQDAAAQEANINRRDKSLQTERVLNKEEDQESQQGFMEREERRLMQLEAIKQQALAEAAKMSGNANARAQANQLIAKADAEAAKIALNAAGDIEKARISAGPGYAAVAQREKQDLRENSFKTVKMGTDILENAADRDAKLKGQKSDGRGPTTFVDPYTKKESDGLSAVRVRESQQFAKDWKLARELINKMTSDAKSFGTWDKVGTVPVIGGTDKAEQARADHAALMKTLARMEQMGAAWSGNEVDNIRQRIGAGPETLYRSDPSTKMLETKRILDQWADAAADYAGIPSFVPPDDVRAYSAEDKYGKAEDL